MFAGRSSGSCRSVGFAEDWEAAPGRLRLTVDGNGVLQDEGGKAEEVCGFRRPRFVGNSLFLFEIEDPTLCKQFFLLVGFL